jgi:hypothetical protein
LKPTKKRPVSVRSNSRNTVRWSTGNLESNNDLDTIQEGPEEHLSRKKSSSMSEGSEAASVPKEPTSATRSLSGDETDDEALFFDALSPGNLEDNDLKRFESFSEFANDGPVRMTETPTLLGAFQTITTPAVLASTAPQPSPTAAPETPPEDVGDAADRRVAESDEVASTTSQADIAGINPMYTEPQLPPGVTTFLLANSTTPNGVHPLYNRSNSFGRSRSFNEGDRRQSWSGRQSEDVGPFAPVSPSTSR